MKQFSKINAARVIHAASAMHFLSTLPTTKNDSVPKKSSSVQSFSAIYEGDNWGCAQRTLGGILYSKNSSPNSTPKIEVFGSRDFYNLDLPISRNTIIGIGSISKQFAAATLIKLWDLELLSKKELYFPEGIDTKLEFFMPLLRAKYPDCNAKFTMMEKDEDYKKVTLRDLLNHTHGLGVRNYDEAKKLLFGRDASNQTPLTLPELINITLKTNFKYGKYCYGNLGSDLSAMIIEVITGKDYDTAVKEIILLPYGLSNTFTQSDNLVLKRHNPNLDIAIGYHFDGPTKKELNLNNVSLSRAAVGFKSKVDDLAKFAPLFMTAQMFESQEVKEAVLNRNKGIRNNPISEDITYHLTIQNNRDGTTIGHPCNDVIFRGDLRLNPTNEEVQVKLTVAETISDSITKEIFEKLHPGEYRVDNMIRSFAKFYNQRKKPLFGSEEYYQVIEDFLETNPETADFIAKYSQVRQEVLNVEPKILAADREKITKELFTKIHRQKHSNSMSRGL